MEMIIGNRYNWKNQPERLVYLGLCISNGPWHQFAKVNDPEKVWCEVREYDLVMFEETAPKVLIVDRIVPQLNVTRMPVSADAEIRAWNDTVAAKKASKKDSKSKINGLISGN